MGSEMNGIKTRFKKGNPGGPGRPKDSIYQKLLKGKMKEEFYEYMFKAWDVKLKDIEALVKDKEKTVPEQMFLRWFIESLKNPDIKHIEMLARFCGIRLDHLTIDRTSSDGSHTPVSLKDLSTEELLKLYQADTDEDN